MNLWRDGHGQENTRWKLPVTGSGHGECHASNLILSGIGYMFFGNRPDDTLSVPGKTPQKGIRLVDVVVVFVCYDFIFNHFFTI